MESCQKVKFGKKEVKTVLNYIRFNQNKRWRKEVRYYHCPDCNHWHLTSRDDFDNDVLDIQIDYPKWEKILLNQTIENGS
jgi:hypothetical protein